MTLLDRIADMWKRIAKAGWQELFAAHGLDLPPDATPADLADRLAKPVKVNRHAPGFADFAPDGVRGIEPGSPARSLFYFALASQSVRTKPDGTLLGDFPSPAELDAVENYVYAARCWSPDEVRAHAARLAGTSLPELAVVVYAVEFRTAASTPHRRHADLCFSRTGIARTGNRDPLYDGAERGFLYRTEKEDAAAIHVAPVRYSAWIAVRLRGRKDAFLPMDHNAMRDFGDKYKPFLPPSRYQRMFLADAGDDARRDFWVPVHKLFDGDECLPAAGPLTVRLTANLQNDKLARLFTYLASLPNPGPMPTAAQRDAPPFTETAGLADFSTDLKTHGAGLLVPRVQQHLVEKATWNNQPLTFKVPPDSQPRLFAALKTPQVPGPRVEYRTMPGYAHIRHDLTNGTFTNLNDTIANPADLLTKLTEGGYPAAAYRDFTADGWVAAQVPELKGLATLPAYALVAPPDFFPRIDQRRLGDVPGDGLMKAWYVPPLALSDVRVPVNLRLTAAGFDPNDTTMTAIVAPADGPPDGAPETTALALDSPRHTSLPDDAAGVFHPGWDAGLTYDGTREFLVNDTLGSPFPEDVKLCAAISSYWPGTVPDAARVFPPINVDSSPAAPPPPAMQFRVLPLLPTVIPMTDREIGMEKGTTAWDGSPAPRLTKIAAGPLVPAAAVGRPAVEYVSPLHADYVWQALNKGFSLAETSKLDFAGYQARVLAMRQVYLALGVQLGPPPADERTPDPRADWLVYSFRDAGPDDWKAAKLTPDSLAFVVKIFKHDVVYADVTQKPVHFLVTLDHDRMLTFLASATRATLLP